MKLSNNVSDRYADIIDMPHHVSSTHPQMKMSSRAAQFSPFAALTGYENAIRNTETDEVKAILESEHGEVFCEEP